MRPGTQTLAKWDGKRRGLETLVRVLACHRLWRQGAETGCMVIGWRMKVQQHKHTAALRQATRRVPWDSDERQATRQREMLITHRKAALQQIEKLATSVAKIKECSGFGPGVPQA